MSSHSPQTPVDNGFASGGATPSLDASLHDFCSTCVFAEVCALAGYGKPELSELHHVVQHIRPFAMGQRIFRGGEPFHALFAVRSGMVKTTANDSEGRERVLGFFLPGEALGLFAIHPGYYPCDAIALERTEVCRFSFPVMSALAARHPDVQRHLFQMFSKELGRASLVASHRSVAQRMAAFLVELGGRYAARGQSRTNFRLGMAHADIASHLCLAPETVSRVLRRFREQGLIALHRKHTELLDFPRLCQLARPRGRGLDPAFSQ